MRYTNFGLMFIVLLIICNQSSALSSGDELNLDITDEAAEVLNNIKQCETSDLPIHGSFVYKQVFDEHTSHAFYGSEVKVITVPAGSKTMYVDYASQENRKRRKFRQEDNDQKIVREFIAAWDGNKGIVYESSKNYATLYSMKKMFDEDFGGRDPRGFSSHENPIYEFIVSEGGKLYLDKDQDQTVLVQRNEYFVYRYYLEPGSKKQYLPTKILCYQNSSGDLVTETEILNHIEHDGRWFISESKTFFPKNKTTVHFTASNVEFTEQPDEFFTIDLPDNTSVYDMIADMFFIVGGGELLPEDVDAIIEDSIRNSDLNFAHSHNDGGESSQAVEENNEPVSNEPSGENSVSASTRPNFFIIVLSSFLLTTVLCFVIFKRSKQS